MKKPAKNVSVDASRQRVTLDGEPLKLQGKAMRVLLMLINRAPEVISRSELIDAIWRGNHLVGERGLNQALWAIRAALGDDARAPQFIRTLAREGYQWIHAVNRRRSKEHRFAFAAAVAASISAIAVLSMGVPATGGAEFTLPGRCSLSGNNSVQAYRVRRDVFVDIHAGCRLIVKPSGQKEFGSPLVSDDGRHVAFTVTENQSCRFVSVDIEGGKRTEFNSCTIND